MGGGRLLKKKGSRHAPSFKVAWVYRVPLFPSPFPFSLSPCPFPLAPFPFPLVPFPSPLTPFPCSLSPVPFPRLWNRHVQLTAIVHVNVLLLTTLIFFSLVFLFFPGVLCQTPRKYCLKQSKLLQKTQKTKENRQKRQGILVQPSK